MSSDSENTIEDRIARWLATGDGQDDVFLAITKLIESRRFRFSQRYGERVTAEAFEDAAGRVFLKIRAGRYNAGRPFRPWLTVVLRNRIFDILRKEERRGGTVFDPDDRERNRIPDDDDTADVVGAVCQNELLARVVAELERLLVPDKRVLFAVTAGLAEHLDRSVLDRWCAAMQMPDEERPGFRAAIDDILATPVHGRQEPLAAVYGIREDACRKRFQRVAEELAKSPLLRALTRLHGGETSAD
jgi:DNA-directed RNA polymerase specialized sigma24 family protein